MADFKSSADLLKGALNKAGEPSNGNSKLQETALNFLNQAYIDLLSGASKYDLDFGQAWSWALEEIPQVVELQPIVSDGTVSLTKDSKSGTFSSAPAESMKDRHLKLDNVAEIYRIKNHVAGSTSFNLQTRFIGTTQAYNFEARKLIYDLGDEVLRIGSSFRTFKRNLEGHGDYKIYHLGYNKFKEEYPLTRIGQELPVHFTVINQKEDFYKIMFSGYVGEETIIEADWIILPDKLTDSSTSIPNIPLQHRTVLEYMTASELLFNNKSDTTRGTIMLNLAKAEIRAMQEAENRLNKNSGRWRGRIIPRRDLVSKDRFDFRRTSF